MYLDTVSGIKSQTVFAQVGRTTLGQTCQKGQKVSRIPEERVRHSRVLSHSYSISCLPGRVSVIDQLVKLSGMGIDTGGKIRFLESETQFCVKQQCCNQLLAA